MGVTLKWQTPESDEATYDKTIIERANSKTGNYTQIHTQDITDNTYFDVDGTTNHWYRIKFEVTATGKISAYSEAIQGGTFTGYCTPEDIRDITNISSTQLSDYKLYKIIKKAQQRVNSAVQSHIIEEKVRSIDTYHENDIDGSNKTYYVQTYKNWFIGDANGDGEITTNDVTVYLHNDNDTITEASIDSVTSNGKITLNTAPPNTTDKITITYYKAPVNIEEPNTSLNLAATFLSSAFAFLNLRADDFDKISFPKLKVSRKEDAFTHYFEKYEKYIEEMKRLVRRT